MTNKFEIQKKYNIKKKIDCGAECVLYTATDGNKLFCAKTIRNWLGKNLATSTIRRYEEKQKASYRAKVKHLTNEYQIGCILHRGKADKEIPVVRMYDLRKVKYLGIEVGYDLLMEFIDGDDLSDTKALKMMNISEKLNYFYQTTLALQYIHKCGVIHLDMKPSNIMIRNGLVKLIDFGVSTSKGHIPTSIAGTIGYLSPEQLSKNAVDEATDIFALGVTFAVIFGGKKLNQKNLDLRKKDTQREASYTLNSSESPLADNIPDLINTIPELNDLIRECTIPQRNKRLSETNLIIARIKNIAKEYDIKLREPGKKITPSRTYLQTDDIKKLLQEEETRLL